MANELQGEHVERIEPKQALEDAGTQIGVVGLMAILTTAPLRALGGRLSVSCSA
jgi:hypothetical protein